MCRKTPIFHIALSLKEKLKQVDFICEPAVYAKNYPTKLADLGLDIGLCPLKESEFNRNKSCIKFYEYAMVGTCAIASDVLPFSEEPVTKMDQLEKLIADKDFRESETKRQYDWVMENRNMDTKWKLWEQAYKSI